jgi:hypothetical protein
MKKEEQLYESIGDSFVGKHSGIEKSQMFGKPCLKTDGKAFASFFQDQMVFKLGGDQHAKAIKMKGAVLFDPSGKGRAMKEWVQVPFAHQKEWQVLTEQALKYVSSSKK